MQRRPVGGIARSEMNETIHLAAKLKEHFGAEELNTHVVDFLRYYCEPGNAFDYAVMLTGPWGSGKTFLINKFLVDRKEQGAKSLYVSLYGITSFRQIEDALSRQLHPVLSSKGMKIATAIMKGTLKTAFKIDLTGDGKDDVTVTSQLPEINIVDYFKTPNECLLVFDDLERCSIPIPETLGYINSFVEHEGLKVIILANEVEILSENVDRYGEIKEKLVGQTLEVRSTAASAIVNFLESITESATNVFLRRHIKEILLLHAQSGTNNLRILKQSLWQFEQLATCFSERHWANDEAILAVLRIVLALSFEIRSGKLKAEQFAEIQLNRFTRFIQNKSSERPNVGIELEARYPEVRFDDLVICAELLKALLFWGRIDRDAVRAALDQSPYYASPGTEPAWKTAWHVWDYDDDVYEEAVAKVEGQFTQRLFVIPGEFLQVFGLQLLFSETGTIKASKSEVVSQCKKYVDDLRAAGKIMNAYVEPAKIDDSGSWGGLGIYDVKSEEFQEVLKYYYDIVDAVAAANLPQLGLDLLQLLKDSPEEYFRALCVNNVSASVYYEVPILARIPVDQFVTWVVGMNPISSRIAFTTFQGRYEHGLLNGPLKEEVPWLREVRRVFEERAETLRPVSRFRILNSVRRSIDPFLGVQEVGSS